MIFRVLLSPHAARDFKKLPPEIKPLVREAIDGLRQEPLTGGKIKALKGRLRSYFRCRVGDYRIVYVVDRSQGVVHIDYMQHRKDVYREID